MLCDMQDTYIIPWHLIYFLLDHLTSKIPDKLLIIKQCSYNFNMIQFLLQFINLTTWKVSTHVFWHSDNLLNNPTLSCSPLGRSSIMILDRPKPLFWAQSRFYCPAKPQLECQDSGLEPPGQGLAQTSRPIYYPALARLHHYYDHSESRLNMSCVMNAQTWLNKQMDCLHCCGSHEKMLN